MEKKKSTLKINADFSNVLSKFDAELKELFPSEKPENDTSVSSEESTAINPMMGKKPLFPPEEPENDTSVSSEESPKINPMMGKEPLFPPEEPENDTSVRNPLQPVL